MVAPEETENNKKAPRRIGAALLLSGLVFPGAGQFLIGRKKTGATIVAIASCLLFLLVQEAMLLLDRILSLALDASGGNPDNIDIFALALQVEGKIQTGRIGMISSGLLLVWAVSMGDILLNGEKRP